MKKLIVIGNGDQSRVFQNIILKQKKFKLTHILSINNHKRTKDKFLPKIKIINHLEKLKKINNYYFLCSITNNYKRKKFIDNFEKKYKKIRWAKIICSSANVSKFSKIEDGTIIGENVYIGPETIIGKHCFINNHSKIEHHNIFDNYSSTGPNVITGGNVNVSKFCYLGINSTLIHNVKIEKNTVIGAKSLVLKSCKSNSTYFGIPAKFKSKRKINKKYL